ncbi:hypothetical protein [Halalkalicoccus ordinarius]|uniref:hypothetical protein n=1 Tax=Halalkalicoccus ordinarius TaxID=3116651 RepID=UPI00300EAABA
MQPTGPSAEPTKRLVCRDCNWTTKRTDGESRESADRAAIGHYTATGHSIESSDAFQRSGSDATNATSSALQGRSDD